MATENRFAKYAQGAPVAAPQVTPLPESPGRRADRERDDAASGRDTVRTGIAVSAEDRAGRVEQRTAAEIRFDQARKLREEFNGSPTVKAYQTIMRQYGNGLKTEPTVAGDQALINSYSQMLNPTSTVMLGEYQATEEVDSTLNKLRERLKKEFGWDGAGRISDGARTQLLQEMQNLSANANQAYNQERDRYTSLAQKNTFDPEDVIGPHLGQAYWQDVYDYWKERGVEVVSDSKDQQGNPLPSGSRAGAAAPPQSGGGWGQSLLAQGLSGANEGLASTLGAPVDIVAAGMDGLTNGFNALVGTNIPARFGERPLGGGRWFRENILAPTIGPEPISGRGQFARRVGQSVGAASVPIGATANTARSAGAQILSALAGGAGAATAQQVAPGNVGAEIGAELLAGGGAGLGLANVGRRAAQREIEAAIPTVDQLKDEAGQLYRQAENNGVMASPQQTGDLATSLRDALVAEGRVSPTGRITEVYPKAKEAMQLVDDYAGMPMNPTQMQTVRSVITDGMMSQEANERRIASLLTDEFDNWANPMAPELADARSVASRYLNAQKLEQAKELAGARAGQFTGSGFENALRTEYRALDRGTIKGKDRYAQDVIDAIQNVSRGTPGSNLARGLGRFKPSGPVSAGLGIGAPTIVGGMVAGPIGAGVAGTTAAALGYGGRAAATSMGIRNSEIAELLARNGGPIQQAPLIDADTQQAIAAILAAQQAEYLE